MIQSSNLTEQLDNWNYVITAFLCGMILILWGKLFEGGQVLKKQSEIALSRRSGESAIVSPKIHENPRSAGIHLDVKSLADSFIKSKEKFQDTEYLRVKAGNQWKSLTFTQVFNKSQLLGSGLLGLGLKPSGTTDTDLQNSMVGIYLKNSPSWIITDHACSLNSLVSVPIHSTYDAEGLATVLNHSQLTVLVTNSEKLPVIWNSKPKYLKNIILTDDVIPADLKDKSIKILSFKQVIESECQSKIKNELPTLDHVFTICYTSGTTGDPKGVILTHKNLIAAGNGLLKIIPERLIPGKNDSHLSFLPMSHIFERMNLHCLTWCGVKIGLGTGDVSKVPGEIIEFKPTLFPTVPRLLTRVYAKIMEKVDSLSMIKRMMFHIALGYKINLLKNGILANNTVWDYLIFSKISEKLGGQIKFIATGAAPVDPKILNFFRAVLGCEIVEGYGQTESCGTGTCTLVGDYENPWGSHVGPPFPTLQLKLVDVPSLGYFATDQPNPRGEICLNGPTIMKGYYKDDAKTRETIINGWLHTGDIGQILPNGTIQILDRVNNIFKLSQGEFICPERIENKLSSKYISQIIIFGNSLDNFCTALVVPEPESVAVWAKNNSFSHLDFKSLCKKENLVKEILQYLSTVGVENGLLGYEIPKAIGLLDEPFTVESGFLTPSLKIKRKLVEKNYRDMIEFAFRMEPNSPQWSKKLHSELASIPFKKDISVEYIFSLSNDLILGNYSSLAWNLLSKYFNFQDKFLEFLMAKFEHFDIYFADRSNFEILDYYKIKASIYDCSAFKNANLEQILNALGFILDSMNKILEKELDNAVAVEWSNLNQEIYAKLIFHKAWNHLKSLVSPTVLVPKLKDVDQDIVDLLISISTKVPIDEMEPTTLVRYSCVSSWMLGTVLCFKGSLRSEKVKRKDLTRLSIDWMLPPVMSLLKHVVDKDSKHVFDYLRNGNLLLIDELSFVKYPWDLLRIVHLTAWYCDSGDIRRWLRKLFPLLMEHSNSMNLNISDIEAFLIGCVFEMTHFYFLKKVVSVQEMLYINTLHPWNPSQIQVQFWQTILSKYSQHKLLLSEELDQTMMSGFITDIRGGSNSCSKIYAYISFRYFRRMKHRNEPLYDECKTFRDYYTSPKTNTSSSTSIWNGIVSSQFFSPLLSYLKIDLDATNSPSNIKSRIENSKSEFESSPLQHKVAQDEISSSIDYVSIQESEIIEKEIVVPEERLKRQLSLLDDLNRPTEEDAGVAQTVRAPEEVPTNNRLSRLLAQLNSL